MRLLESSRPEVKMFRPLPHSNLCDLPSLDLSLSPFNCKKRGGGCPGKDQHSTQSDHLFFFFCYCCLILILLFVCYMIFFFLLDSLSAHLSPSLPPPSSLCLSISFALFFFSFSLSPTPLSVSLSLPLSLCLPLSICLSLPLLPSLSVYLCLSLGRSFCHLWSWSWSLRTGDSVMARRSGRPRKGPGTIRRN